MYGRAETIKMKYHQSSSGVKATTSSIFSAPDSSMTRRSMPMAFPAAAGMSARAL